MIRQRQSNMDMMSTSPGDIQPGTEPIKLFSLFAKKSQTVCHYHPKITSVKILTTFGPWPNKGRTYLHLHLTHNRQKTILGFMFAKNFRFSNDCGSGQVQVSPAFIWTRAKCCQTFYGRNFRMIVKVLRSRVGSWPYPQTLGRLARDKNSSFLRTRTNTSRKKF